jgi:hypothetical protein
LSVLKSLWYRIIEFGKMNAMNNDGRFHIHD